MRKKSIQDAREEGRVVDGDLRSDVQTDVPSSPRFCASRCLVLASEHPDTGRQFALDQVHVNERPARTRNTRKAVIQPHVTWISKSTLNSLSLALYTVDTLVFAAPFMQSFK
jgi:hypothetical protein